MAETHRARTPTWAAFLAGAAVALLLALAWLGWTRMQGSARQLDVRVVAPAAPVLPLPTLPDAPRIPDAPVPRPK